MNIKITEDMLIALRDGDHKAFEMVFISYFKKVKYFINGLIKSEEDAEEISQDLFVKLWVMRESIDTARNFGTFIYSSAKNATFDYLRGKCVRDAYASDQMQLDEGVTSTEENYFAEEIKLLIEMTVEQMPDRRKEIFELSRNNGMSNDEISKKLHISKKTVENHLNLALKELRRAVSSFLLFFI